MQAHTLLIDADMRAYTNRSNQSNRETLLLTMLAAISDKRSIIITLLSLMLNSANQLDKSAQSLLSIQLETNARSNEIRYTRHKPKRTSRLQLGVFMVTCSKQVSFPRVYNRETIAPKCLG